MEEIKNKVANSSLIQIDLEDFYPTEEIVEIDFSDYLYEGLILREKDFRAILKSTDWSVYKDKLVIIKVTEEVVLPSWAFMLLTSHLKPNAKLVHLGSVNSLLASYYQTKIDEMLLDDYKNGKIIIKGCSNKPIPESSFVYLFQKLQKVASSIMFGEACSSVPIYKKPK